MKKYREHIQSRYDGFEGFSYNQRFDFEIRLSKAESEANSTWSDLGQTLQEQIYDLVRSIVPKDGGLLLPVNHDIIDDLEFMDYMIE